jgi:hypothetical protein
MLNPDRVAWQRGSRWVSRVSFVRDMQRGFEWPRYVTRIDSARRKRLFTTSANISGDGFVRSMSALPGSNTL